jgi:hypothetical protein
MWVLGFREVLRGVDAGRLRVIESILLRTVSIGFGWMIVLYAADTILINSYCLFLCGEDDNGNINGEFTEEIDVLFLLLIASLILLLVSSWIRWNTTHASHLQCIQRA